MPPATIIEVKRRLDGSEQRFECDFVTRTRDLVVVCFRYEARAGFFASYAGPVASYGLFWRRRPYNCYVMVRPSDGVLLAARFDVVRDVQFDATEVRYTDLLLDLWVESGVPQWQDEDEVAEAEATGRLVPADSARITRAREVLARGHTRIIAEARGALREVGATLA